MGRGGESEVALGLLTADDEKCLEMGNFFLHLKANNENETKESSRN